MNTLLNRIYPALGTPQRLSPRPRSIFRRPRIWTPRRPMIRAQAGDVRLYNDGDMLLVNDNPASDGDVDVDPGIPEAPSLSTFRGMLVTFADITPCPGCIAQLGGWVKWADGTNLNQTVCLKQNCGDGGVYTGTLPTPAALNIYADDSCSTIITTHHFDMAELVFDSFSGPDIVWASQIFSTDGGSGSEVPFLSLFADSGVSDACSPFTLANDLTDCSFPNLASGGTASFTPGGCLNPC